MHDRSLSMSFYHSLGRFEGPCLIGSLLENCKACGNYMLHCIRKSKCFPFILLHNLLLWRLLIILQRCSPWCSPWVPKSLWNGYTGLGVWGHSHKNTQTFKSEEIKTFFFFFPLLFQAVLRHFLDFESRWLHFYRNICSVWFVPYMR